MEKFKINEFGVATNPEIIPIYVWGIRFDIHAKLAQKEGVWSFGFNVEHWNGFGSSVGVNFKERKSGIGFFASREEALSEAKKRILKIVRNHQATGAEYPRDVFKALEGYNQISLF